MTYDTQTPEQTPKKKPGLWSAIVYFVGVAALVGGIWWLDNPRDSDPVAVEQTTTTTTVENVDVDLPPRSTGEEPIADAAEIILPSVVQIDVEGGGVGSGIIYDAEGLIITAAHVVADRETVGIRFEDGRTTTGTVLGAAPQVDIAVIQVEEADLQPARFFTDKPRVGQMAIAVGSPWGLSSTVTAGIVSAVDQTANCNSLGCASLLQTDAAINPGNSGGALVDREGRVLGINVSIFTSSGANDGVGFAVPSDIALDYADSIVSGEPIESGFLGVQGAQAEAEDRNGVEITNVIEGTAADRAGIQVGDVIVFFDGVAVESMGELSAQVRAHRPGDSVTVVLVRDGEQISVELILGERTEQDLS